MKEDKEKVVFLDRDGTLNTEVNYLYRPEDLELFPDVAKALARLKQHGFKLVVVTNQAGVARGYYGEEDVNRLHRYLNSLLAADGAEIDHFFYCPHHPEHGVGKYKTECHCRKPNPGMLKMAEQFYRIDKAHSYMIGDKLVDMELSTVKLDKEGEIWRLSSHGVHNRPIRETRRPRPGPAR